MATKKITLKGGQLMDTNNESVGWVADDTSGLHLEGEANAEGEQHAYCTLTHMVTETNNPIWNEINFHGDYVISESLSDRFVTLQGIKPDGTINDIMEIHGSGAVTWSGTDRFDLLGSSCTNDMYKQEAAASTNGAGTIDVKIPLRYSKYEDVDLVGAWFDTAWQYRIAITLERTNGQLHGSTGHYSDYYGYTVYVPYSANMSSTTQDDVRFTGPDGVTLLPFYQLDVVDSTSAVYIVMIPWGWLDKEAETHTYEYGPTFTNPQYIHCYYGNASATSASDVTLGGYALFYDDFTDEDRSDAMWTFSGNANTTEVIENGYLELRSAASQTSEANCYADADFSGSDNTSWEVIWKIIYDTPAYTNTTTSNGPYLRIRGRDNTASGGANETTSYWEVKHYYIAAGAGESGTNIAGHMWGHASYDSGVLAYGTLYANNLNCAVNDTQYIKFKWNKRDSTGSNDGVWAHSDDGVNWNTLGDSGAGLTSVFDTVTDLQIAMYYVGKSGVAADKYIRFDAIMAYPTMSGTKQKIEWEESFQNGTYLDRYKTLNTGAARVITETQDSLKMETINTTAQWTTATKTGLCLYLGGGVSGPTDNINDVLVMEGTITAVTENATASAWQDGCICLNDRAGITSADATLFGLRYNTGGSRIFLRQTFVGGTLSLEDGFGTWTQADLPIGLRMIFDSKHRIVYYQARKYGSGGEWRTIFRSPTAYTQAVTAGFTMPYLVHKTSNNNQTGSTTFSNFKVYNGGGILDCNGKAGTVTAWMDEEDYTNDYPLALTSTPDPDDQTISFNIPSPMKHGNPMKLRTKDFGGDYNYSKTFYISDDDVISVGPSGTDQYIGMRLVFDFTFDSTDEISFDKIEFLYEVI